MKWLFFLTGNRKKVGVEMKQKYVFTSESVSEGHPDKMCDRISDSILDAYLAQDPYAKVACEVLVTTNTVVLSGEVNTTAEVDVEQVARAVIAEIGYISEDIGMDAESCNVINVMDQQSADIAQGVDARTDAIIGAGDQGIMFGYAEQTGATYMPLPIVVAHAIVKRATELRKSGKFVSARPDMKSQVTLAYVGDTIEVETIVCSIQHDANYDKESFKAFLENEVIAYVLAEHKLEKSADFQLHFNPTGRFVIGGPHGDTGLTGRKIIVDTFGGVARHGGGAFSGKDATKVDRSAAYMARYLAKNIVASGVASKCEIQLAYAIGVAEPVAIFLETFGTEQVAHAGIIGVIEQAIDLTPAGIIERFKLRRPIFAQTASYGHFGRTDVDFPWEELSCKNLFEKLLKN